MWLPDLDPKFLDIYANNHNSCVHTLASLFHPLSPNPPADASSLQLVGGASPLPLRDHNNFLLSLRHPAPPLAALHRGASPPRASASSPFAGAPQSRCSHRELLPHAACHARLSVFACRHPHRVLLHHHYRPRVAPPCTVVPLAPSRAAAQEKTPQSFNISNSTDSINIPD